MAKSPRATSASDTPASYEAALTELETLVQKMEQGELSLEQSLASYQRGTELLRYCQQALTAVEAQVKILDGELLQVFKNPAQLADE
ncbi:MAG: exodeoxyribonuclease VII small subunit [Burkholderiaceae bacterium]|nr:MAG: exodeoxyribonuclease VII small subunit [Burkholderiaceae bacterium]